MGFRIGAERGAEAGQILEALRPGDLRHLALDALHLGQAQRVDLRGRVAGGGHLLDVVAVDRIAVRQRPHAGLAAPVRRIVLRHELAQLAVGRTHVVVDRGEDLVVQALLVSRRHRLGEVLQRLGEHAVHAGGLGDAVDLRDDFFQQILRRHQPVAHALLRHRGHLVEAPGHRLQARQVILVFLRVVERDRADEAGQLQVDAAHLVQRHLVQLQPVAAQLVLQLAHHQLLVELVGVGETAGVDRLEALQVIGGDLVLGRHVRQRHVAPAVVVAQVAQHGGELRRVLQLVLPLLGQQRVERLHPRRRIGRRSLRRRRGMHG